MNTIMGILTMFGWIGMYFNDVVASISVLGSLILLVSAIFFPNASSKKLADFVNWGIGGLIFGGLFQLCLLITGSMPEKIGIFFQMPSGIVNALFVLSFLLLLVTCLNFYAQLE